MHILWIIILLSATPAQGIFEHLLEDLKIPDILAGCVTTAADVFFELGEVIMFMLPQNGSDLFPKSFVSFNRILVEELYRTKKWSLMVYSANFEQPRKRRRFSLLIGKPNNYVMIVNNARDISESLRYLDLRRMLNPFADFIIINTQAREELLGNAQPVLNELWSYNILSGVIMFPDANSSNAFDIYTWNPFADGKCGEDADRLFKIGVCNSTVLRTTATWFADKMPKKLNGCPIKVRTIVSPPFVMDYTSKVEGTEDEYIFETGIDIQIMNMVAEIANFTVRYSMSGKSDDYGGNNMRFRNASVFQNMTNQTFPQFNPPINQTLPASSSLRASYWNINGMNASTGILDMLRSKRADIGIGSMSVSLNAADLEVSYPYSQDSLIFCVPHSFEVPHWKKLAEIIDTKTWITTFTTMFLTFFVVRTSARRYKKERAPFKNSIDVGCALLQIITANIIKTQPTMTKVRMYLMMWIIFSLYFDIAYQTSLMSTLTKIDYESQITTQEAILKSKLDVLFLESSMQFFKTWNNDDTPELIALKKRWKVCDDLHECMEQTARERTSAVATSKSYTEYEIGHYYSSGGEPLLYCFNKNILTFPIAMYMRTGFPFKNKINKLIYLLDASGFVDHWVTTIFRKSDIFRKVEYQSNVHLTYEHFIPIFVISLIGNTLAGVTFMAELFVFKYRQHHEESNSLGTEMNGFEKNKHVPLINEDNRGLTTLSNDREMDFKKPYYFKDAEEIVKVKAFKLRKIHYLN